MGLPSRILESDQMALLLNMEEVFQTYGCEGLLAYWRDTLLQYGLHAVLRPGWFELFVATTREMLAPEDEDPAETLSDVYSCVWYATHELHDEFRRQHPQDLPGPPELDAFPISPSPSDSPAAIVYGLVNQAITKAKKIGL